MNRKDNPEYKRVREEMFTLVDSVNFNRGLTSEECTNQILAIEGLEIRKDEQRLPKECVECGDSPSLKDENWVKVI